MYLRTHGVILSRKNFGEADRILKIYTLDFGKVSVLAKGVRRPRSRKGGHLEIGNWCKVFIAKGRNLDLLTEVELKKSFSVNNFSYEKANKIYHFLELAQSLTQDHQRNEGVFKLLISYLARIEREENFDLVSVVFKIKLLKLLGFFSAKNLKESKTRAVLELIEDEDFLKIKEKLTPKTNTLSPQTMQGTTGSAYSEKGSAYSEKNRAYLKLLSFLDSIIENITESKIKTNRFLNVI